MVYSRGQEAFVVYYIFPVPCIFILGVYKLFSGDLTTHNISYSWFMTMGAKMGQF